MTALKSVFLVARHVLSGFTLIELLVSVAIMSVMLSLGLPKISHYFVEKQLQQAVLLLQGHIKHARDTAAGTECDAEIQLKQVTKQLHISIQLNKTKHSRGCLTWFEASDQPPLADKAEIRQDRIFVELMNSPMSIVFRGTSGALSSDHALQLKLRIKDKTIRLQLDGIGNGVLLHED